MDRSCNAVMKAIALVCSLEIEIANIHTYTYTNNEVKNRCTTHIYRLMCWNLDPPTFYIRAMNMDASQKMVIICFHLIVFYIFFFFLVFHTKNIFISFFFLIRISVSEFVRILINVLMCCFIWHSQSPEIYTANAVPLENFIFILLFFPRFCI